MYIRDSIINILKSCRVHYVKSVRIRSFFGLYFPAFGLNTDRYGVSLRIHSECGKIRTRKTPNTDTFYAVVSIKDRFLICRSFLPSASRPGIVTSLCENSGVNGMRTVLFSYFKSVVMQMKNKISHL